MDKTKICLCVYIYGTYVFRISILPYLCVMQYFNVIHVKRSSIAKFKSQKEVVCTTHLWNPKKAEARPRNQRDRDCRAAESAQQREARLTRWRVRDRAHRALQSAAQRERVLGHRRGQLPSETPYPRMSRLELG